MANIVVFGGSFNPITIAHEKVAMDACHYLNAKKVILLPCHYDFFKKWKKMGDQVILKHDIRLQCMQLVADQYPQMEISYIEINEESYYTYDSLKLLSKQYPDDTLYWLFGDDKCGELNRWNNWENLLSEFHFLMVSRDSENAAQLFSQYDYLKPYASHFKFMQSNPFISEISATKIRQALKQNDKATVKQYCNDKVYELLVEKGVVI